MVPLKISMLVIDANEVAGAPVAHTRQLSPVLHPAVHNVLSGLRDRNDIEVEVVYGRGRPEPEEARRDGCLTYVPVPYRTLPLPGIGGPYASRLLALLRHLRKSKPDVVHAQGTEREAGMVAALSGIPALLTLHGNFRSIARLSHARPFSYPWINARLESFILPRIEGVLCISRYTQELVKPLNPRTWLLPNPSAPAFFAVDRRPLPGRIVCLGMIEERKNQILLMEACDRLAADGVPMELHYWGPIHPERDYDRRFLEGVAARPWAAYPGNSRLEEIPSILAQASLLVLPSLEDNCPMVIIEAMAAGLPVVASDVGGIPDLVEHGRTGLLFPSNDAAALAAAIRTILSDESTSHAFSLAAKQEAENRFRPSSVAAAHVRIYQEIAGSHPSSSPP